MKKQTKWILAGGIATSAIVAAGLAVAVERHDNHHKHGEYGENGHQGKFHKGYHQMRFGKGQMTLEGLQSSLNERFLKLDSDNDGTVTAEEFSAQAIARFTTIDADGNGELTREEIKAARQAYKDQRRSNADKDDSPSDT